MSQLFISWNMQDVLESLFAKTFCFFLKIHWAIFFKNTHFSFSPSFHFSFISLFLSFLFLLLFFSFPLFLFSSFSHLSQCLSFSYSPLSTFHVPCLFPLFPLFILFLFLFFPIPFFFSSLPFFFSVLLSTLFTHFYLILSLFFLLFLNFYPFYLPSLSFFHTSPIYFCLMLLFPLFLPFSFSLYPSHIYDLFPGLFTLLFPILSLSLSITLFFLVLQSIPSPSICHLFTHLERNKRNTLFTIGTKKEWSHPNHQMLSPSLPPLPPLSFLTHHALFQCCAFLSCIAV